MLYVCMYACLLIPRIISQSLKFSISLFRSISTSRSLCAPVNRTTSTCTKAKATFTQYSFFLLAQRGTSDSFHSLVQSFFALVSEAPWLLSLDFSYAQFHFPHLFSLNSDSKSTLTGPSDGGVAHYWILDRRRSSTCRLRRMPRRNWSFVESIELDSLTIRTNFFSFFHPSLLSISLSIRFLSYNFLSDR